MTPPRTGRATAEAGHRAGIVSPRRPAPAPDRPRHLDVVRGRPAPGPRPPPAAPPIAASVTAVVVLVIVVARVLIGQGGFAESGVEGRIVDAQRQVEQLELEVAQLRAPQRVYDRATQLGLVVPDRVEFLTPKPAPSATVTSSPPKASTKTSPGRGGR